MKKVTNKSSLLLISILVSIVVGIINTAGALVAYQSFVPRQTKQTSPGFITEVTAAPAQQTAAQAAPIPAPPVNTEVKVRTNGKVSVGGSAKPASARTAADGTVTYKWCSGKNPNLEDGVCEAIASIAASPTADNPHISDRGKRSLGLMPKVDSITMDESSWVATSDTSGTMLVTADTADYGPVKLKVTLDKINGVWVLTNGALA